MPYQIPQNLKYKEKIAFGLTFSQMAWLGLFSATAAVIYLKTSLPFPLKETTALFSAGLGVGFAFFNFAEQANNIIAYRKSVGKAGYFDKKMQQLVDVKKIENDTIFLKDGSTRTILQVTPINFSMLSKDEQHAIIKAYKDFLNSLDFTVQIVVRTVNLSLEKYLQVMNEKALESKNERLLQQFESFREFVNQFIEKNTVKDRLFYLIIPNSAENSTPLKKQQAPQQALKQLDIRVQLCQQKLKKCNLLTRRLDSNELASLLASFFHGFIEAKNEYFYPATLLKQFEIAEQKQKWLNAHGIETTIQNAEARA